MAIKSVLLLGIVLFGFLGCVRHVPTSQIVCTRPQLAEKKVLVTVAPVVVSGEASDRFTGAVETAVQTWIRGRGAHTVEEPPYDFRVFGTVSESGDASLGVATVTLKMITTGSEVVANGAGTAVYNGGAWDGVHSDMQAVGRAARLAAENLCMTREREYLYIAPRLPPETHPADPYVYSYPYGYTYGMEVYPAPFYRGSVHIRSVPRVRHRHHHHPDRRRGRHRLGGRSRR